MSVPIRRHDDDSDDGLTVRRAARELGCCHRKIRQMLADGTLRGEKISGKWRIPRRSVERLKGERADEQFEGHDRHLVGRERTRARRRRR